MWNQSSSLAIQSKVNSYMMEWAGITAKGTNHTPYYLIPSSGIFILGNTLNQTGQSYCFLVLGVSIHHFKKHTVKSIFVHSVNEVITKHDHWLLQKNHLGKIQKCQSCFHFMPPLLDLICYTLFLLLCRAFQQP